MSPSPPPREPAADLLEHLLGSLLADFRLWFSRGELLLDLCPDSVMGADQRQALRESLAEASRQLTAATSLPAIRPCAGRARAREPFDTSRPDWLTCCD